MMKHRIRPAEPKEFDTLLAIDRECFPPGIAFDAWELSYYLARPASLTLVAEVEDQITAFALCDIAQLKVATLVTLDVLNQFRRSGLGSSLLHRSEQLLQERGARVLELQVDTGNSVAVSFYTAHGFTLAGKLKAYYGNGRDAHVMRKSLRPGDLTAHAKCDV